MRGGKVYPIVGRQGFGWARSRGTLCRMRANAASLDLSVGDSSRQASSSTGVSYRAKYRAPLILGAKS